MEWISNKWYFNYWWGIFFFHIHHNSTAVRYSFNKHLHLSMLTYRQCPQVNVWAGILVNYIVEPFFIGRSLPEFVSKYYSCCSITRYQLWPNLVSARQKPSSGCKRSNYVFSSTRGHVIWNYCKLRLSKPSTYCTSTVDKCPTWILWQVESCIYSSLIWLYSHLVRKILVCHWSFSFLHNNVATYSTPILLVLVRYH